MRITQWGEYGIHCCAFIASKHQQGATSVSAQEIADSQGIDLQYAQQILQRLRRSDVVQSVRGPHGGYKISKSPAEITLYDILHAAEGDTFEVICEHKPLNDARCAEGTNCSLREVWYNLRLHIDKFLSDITLQSLLSQQVSETKPVRIGKAIQLAN